MEEARRPLWRAPRRASRWSWIAAPLAAGLLVIGCAEEDPTTDLAGPDTTVERTTTTTERPTTTTTRRRPTTTTAPPTTAPPTTAPPTTAPPPPPPPPTTAPPPPPPPPPPPASDCNPNYSGCVPNDSDVDCAGGSGNGPSYVSGPVQVIGSDPYDLDRDGDGLACE
jgi:hypothetical protein